MEFNCENIVSTYLLNRNPLYTFSLPISVLVAIVIFGLSKVMRWSENSYIQQILVPFLAFLITMIVIDTICRWTLSKEEVERHLATCNAWTHKKIEKFSASLGASPSASHSASHSASPSASPSASQGPIEPIEEIPNIHPAPLEFQNETGAKCISKSNCCSICSGTQNSCKLNAPVPGPQWLPQSAKSVQDRLVHNDYTKSRC